MAMEVAIERITPTKAEKMLNRNHENRKLRSGVVEKYASDMKAGTWTECTDPLAFYENGDIADGQHRLFAVVESNVPQSFIVVRGLSREAGLNIDMGLNRSLVDNARISGTNTDLSHSLLAVTRACAEGEKQSKALSNASRLHMVAVYGVAAKWAISAAPKTRPFCQAVIIAAIARAWYYEADKGRLNRFCEVLGNGFMEDENDSAAVALRNYLLINGTRVSTSSTWRDTFLKAQNAIRYFMRGKKLTVIKAVKDECYSTPTTTTTKKAA